MLSTEQLTGKSMANVPRWSKLKHFSNVSTMKYADRQAFLDILKVSTDFVL